MFAQVSLSKIRVCLLTNTDSQLKCLLETKTVEGEVVSGQKPGAGTPARGKLHNNNCEYDECVQSSLEGGSL